MYARFIRYFVWPDIVFFQRPVAKSKGKEMGKIEKVKDAIKNDLELFLYLHKDKDKVKIYNKWKFEIDPSYLRKFRATQEIFTEVLEEFCIDNHLVITKRQHIHKTMFFFIDREDRSRLKPEDWGEYEGHLTIKRQ